MGAQVLRCIPVLISLAQVLRCIPVTAIICERESFGAMAPWAMVIWLYELYISIAKKCALLHGDVWVSLSMIFQGFIGWGLFTIAIYRVYVIKTGIRNFTEEFASYGLPMPSVMVILACLMEFGMAAIFTASIVLPELVFLTSLVLAALMFLAVVARIKGKEPCKKMIPAIIFGLVPLVCILIDRYETHSDSDIGIRSFTSSRGRAYLMMLVLAGDLAAIGVTVYRYRNFLKEKSEKSALSPLNVRLVVRRHGSKVLEGVL